MPPTEVEVVRNDDPLDPRFRVFTAAEATVDEQLHEMFIRTLQAHPHIVDAQFVPTEDGSLNLRVERKPLILIANSVNAAAVLRTPITQYDIDRFVLQLLAAGLRPLKPKLILPAAVEETAVAA